MSVSANLVALIPLIAAAARRGQIRSPRMRSRPARRPAVDFDLTFAILASPERWAFRVHSALSAQRDASPEGLKTCGMSEANEVCFDKIGIVVTTIPQPPKRAGWNVSKEGFGEGQAVWEAAQGQPESARLIGD